jgi:protein-tyrosine phosphatase
VCARIAARALAEEVYCACVIDLHSHILPGLDDGARSLEDSREIARRALADGVTVMVATPHVRADYPTTPDEMESAVRQLREDFEEQDIQLEVLPGGELDVGLLWQLPRVELARFTLAQTGRYLLLETPYRGSPVALGGAVARLRQGGITTLLAHPERNPVVQDRPDVLAPLLASGALVQVTAASVDGRLGRAAQLAAEKLMRMGAVHVIATDAHAPELREAGLAAATAAVGDEDLARFLTDEAPAAILAGHPLPDRPASRARLSSRA